MAERRTLLVPIRLDGLYVDSEGPPSGSPMADFAKLPYNLANNSTQNGDVPNLAGIAFGQRAPLSYLKGLHLHWALPDALATGHHRGAGGTTFPAVPNRWLVRRLDHTGALQASTIVESDFLHPYDDKGAPIYDPPPAGMANWPPITFATKRATVSQKPGPAFRYMGRALPLDQWLVSGKGSDYLNQRDGSSGYKFSHYPLTAVGYGEPAFAAYYPNCFSVFGFCDVDPALQAGSSYQYEVIGWFNEQDLDPLQSSEFAQLASDAARYTALAHEYRWSLPQADASGPFPKLSVYYGSVTLTPGNVKPWQAPGDHTLRMAIGNTGGEALAALLADQIATPADNPDKVVIEDQLEAINVASALQGVEVDYAAHVAQTRHQRGFRGVAGGSRWAVRPVQSQLRPIVAAQAARDDRDAVPLSPLTPAVPVPDAVAHALDALNTAQEAYDMAQQEIAELRYQTFCDWHKFLAAYYSDGPDLEWFRKQIYYLGQFISEQTLQLLNDKLALTGTLTLTKDAAQAEGVVTAALALATNILTPAEPGNKTLAVQVLLRLQTLAARLKAAKLTDQYEIARVSADHFWRAREPVVLLSGPVATATARHGQDGDLPCNVLDLPDVPGSKAFLNALAAMTSAVAHAPFTQTQSASPWHPILLEWGVLVSPVQTGRTRNKDINNTWDYDPTFVTGTYQLAANQPDLSRPASLCLLDQKNSYQGRCVMTPTAGTQLDTSLSTFLLRTTLDDCRDRAASGEADYIDRLISWYSIEHKVPTPTTNAEKLAWLKLQRPFVDPVNKDANGNAQLLKIGVLLTWYGDKPVNGTNNTVKSWNATQQAHDPIYSAIRALSQLQGMPVLSQALGGFNAALMTRAQVLQIPIENPLDDAVAPPQLAALDLTTNVARAVGRHHPTAPRSSDVFCPIRSGELTLDSLILIDTFGQQWKAPLQGARLVTSNGLSDPDLGANITYLPPRLSPPARLNFRWLAALSGQNGIDEVEMNSTPATTPVCGWLLPNKFDNSLMVYDHTGKALGSINLLAEWMPAPGESDRMTTAGIPNPHLRRLIQHLVVEVGTPQNEVIPRQKFMDSFLSTIDSALEAIEPASFAQHEALALLIGRPVAVVRARVDLQLMGQPTDAETVDDPTIPGGKAIGLKRSALWKSFVDQDWGVFAYDWGKFYDCSYGDIMGGSCPFFNDVPRDQYARTTHSFEKVVVPVRLGEHQLLNDGLVGFWKEGADGELDDVFHATQSGATDNLSLTLQDDPLALTMLMDPRGVVHATCGILPVTQLQIPAAYYADALARMGVTFLVSPILTDAEELYAAVPKEGGYTWSWVTTPDGVAWKETSTIVAATEHAHFFKPPTLVEGWLKLTPTTPGSEKR